MFSKTTGEKYNLPAHATEYANSLVVYDNKFGNMRYF